MTFHQTLNTTFDENVSSAIKQSRQSAWYSRLADWYSCSITDNWVRSVDGAKLAPSSADQTVDQ